MYLPSPKKLPLWLRSNYLHGTSIESHTKLRFTASIIFAVNHCLIRSRCSSVDWNSLST